MSKKEKAQILDLYIKIRVNQAEMDLIKRKFRGSGMQTFSKSFAQKSKGYIMKIDGSKFQEIHKLAASIARNIDQITNRFHDTDRFYENNISELKDGVNRLWQPLIFLQREILKIRH